ncbi:MAG: hypothetical protein HY962_06985 [Ignavibacteriae bacterium]|nr:hypothetical protein [Ignavibacteriota bacterium]
MKHDDVEWTTAINTWMHFSLLREAAIDPHAEWWIRTHITQWLKHVDAATALLLLDMMQMWEDIREYYSQFYQQIQDNLIVPDTRAGLMSMKDIREMLRDIAGTQNVDENLP